MKNTPTREVTSVLVPIGENVTGTGALSQKARTSQGVGKV